MKETDHRLPENLGLAEGNIHHNIEPLSEISYREGRAGQQEIPDNPPEGKKKNRNSEQ